MTDFETFFGSQYLRAADLKGREVTVAIASVRPEKVGDKVKPVVAFVGARKALVLNRTNAEAIALLYGREVERWAGHLVTLHVVSITDPFRVGGTVAAIRVKGSPELAQPLEATVQRGRKTIKVSVVPTAPPRAAPVAAPTKERRT